MSADIQFSPDLDDALRRAGSNWNAAQTHGLLSSRLAVEGAGVANAWLAQVLEGADENNALTYGVSDAADGSVPGDPQGSCFERQSAFEPLVAG